MKKIFISLLLIIFLVGCDDDIIYDEFENDVTKTEEIRDIKEESNLLTVAQYSKAIEMAILEYQLDHDNMPDTYCDIALYIDYNYDIVCDIDFKEDYEIVLKHCQVGNYKKHSYGFNKGAMIEEKTKFTKKQNCK